MYSTIKPISHLFFAVLSLIFCASVNALPGDKSQPIHIKSDSAERNEQSGTTTYRGDVTIDQGSMNISGDEVVFYGSRAITKIVAKGRPARLSQIPNSQKGKISARGYTITYELTKQAVELKQQAYIEQEGSTVRGSRIFYDMNKQIIKADSKGKPNERVRMTIPAQSTEQQ